MAQYLSAMGNKWKCVCVGGVPGNAVSSLGTAVSCSFISCKLGLISGKWEGNYSESCCGFDLLSRVYLGGEIREPDPVKGCGRKED